MSFATPESMPDGRQAVAALDALSARQSGTDELLEPDTLKFVGLDFRGEVLLPIIEERTDAPSWWNSEQSRVSLLLANFQGASLRSANLTGVFLEQANFAGADLADTLLQGAFLGGANFDRALLEETDLSGAYLRFSTFREGVLEGANLRGADLWGAKLPEVDADKADFREAQLEEADFRDADAREVDFRDSKLGLADFRNADLRMSDFRGCVPRATKFDGADLRRANLEQLDLTNTSLVHVWLSDARLERTRFYREQLGGMIGEELAGEYELARRGYLALEQNFAAIGDPPAASWAYRRRRRMEKLETRRKAFVAFQEKHWGRAFGLIGKYLNHKLVELVCDYGESVPRVLMSQLTLLLVFTTYYAVTGAVHRDDEAQIGGGTATDSVIEIVTYSMMAMLAPGAYPAGFHPADQKTQLITLVQSYLGIFLIGLLGFVAGNRIHR